LISEDGVLATAGERIGGEDDAAFTLFDNCIPR
jgi:hypothetical protein